MIEPPEIPEDEIADRLGRRFGLRPTSINFMPHGNDSFAWSYRVEGDGVWFLKVLGRSLNRGAVEVPRYLASLGVEHLVETIPTVNGDSVDTGEPFTFVVSPYFAGTPAGKAGVTGALRTQLGRSLRDIHDAPVSPPIDAVMRHERFDVREAAFLLQALEEAPRRRPDDDIEEAFLRTWHEHAGEITRSLDRGAELSQYAKSNRPEMVICHADYHAWNVLVGLDGDFVIVDWDETLVAPRERDLMFVDGNVADLDPEGTDFYAGYGDVNPDRRLLAYYRHDWVLQEVADYHRRAFNHSLGDATRAEAVDYFAALFGPDDVVQAALDADARLPD